MKSIFYYFILILFIAATTGCANDDEPALTAEATITSADNIGDLDGDVTGNGGSYTQTFDFINQMTTADFNMDITATQGGSFNMVVQDADGTEVLDRSLIKGQGDDSASGVTSVGTEGTWKVIITLSDFNGDGSFSLSEGN